MKGHAIMKKVVSGVTYNTETSTMIARGEAYENERGHKVHPVLYQTQGGAFFLHHHAEWGIRQDGEWQARESDEFEPCTADQAHKWVLKGPVEIVSDAFEAPPEAVAERTASATIYLRVPEALKRQLEQAAKSTGQSLNVWAMRC